MPLGEADTRAKLIDPALHACGWTEDLIRREETAGAVEVVGERARRRPKGRVDYTLRLRVNAASQPVAVALLEAKAEHLPPAHGLEQAKTYAVCRRLNVLLAFASNGHQFVVYDKITGQTTSPRPLSQFPTPAELRAQGLAAFQNVFGADAAPVSSGNPQKNARVLIATYQTLDVAFEDADANFLVANYPENYFSHIVIDECHRSAWGKWSQVLTRNPDAVQIGLTATPRQIELTERSP